MVYTRAAASDYDDWETLFGNKGWGSKDLIPLLKKVWPVFSLLNTCLKPRVRLKHSNLK